MTVRPAHCVTEPLGATTSLSGARFYTDPETGQRPDSVTTCLGMIAKPAIAPWYAKESGLRVVNEWDTLCGMMDGSIKYTSPAGRVTRPYTHDEIAKWVARAAPDKRDAAGVRGSAIHKVAELESEGRAHEVGEDVYDMYWPYIDGYRQFVSDYEVTFVSTETTFMNLTVGYAGSADAIVNTWSHPDVPIILDWKTSKNGPYNEWAYQVAAYANAEFILVRDGSVIRRAPMPEVSKERGMVVRLTPEGYEVHEFGKIIPMAVAFAAFKAAKNLHTVQKIAKEKPMFQKGMNVT